MLGFWTKYNKIPVKSLLGQGSVEGRQQQILGSKEEVYEKGGLYVHYQYWSRYPV